MQILLRKMRNTSENYKQIWQSNFINRIELSRSGNFVHSLTDLRAERTSFESSTMSMLQKVWVIHWSLMTQKPFPSGPDCLLREPIWGPSVGPWGRGWRDAGAAKGLVLPRHRRLCRRLWPPRHHGVGRVLFCHQWLRCSGLRVGRPGQGLECGHQGVDAWGGQVLYQSILAMVCF